MRPEREEANWNFMNADIDDDRSQPLHFEDSIGFLLRRALQRHQAIFAELINSDLTRTQMAVLAWLYERGACSQNLLGRHLAIDTSTIKGVVDRLCDRGFTKVGRDRSDGRRLIVGLTDEGRDVFEVAFPLGRDIAERTLEGLSTEETRNAFRVASKVGLKSVWPGPSRACHTEKRRRANVPIKKAPPVSGAFLYAYAYIYAYAITTLKSVRISAIAW